MNGNWAHLAASLWFSFLACTPPPNTGATNQQKATKTPPTGDAHPAPARPHTKVAVRIASLITSDTALLTDGTVACLKDAARCSLTQPEVFQRALQAPPPKTGAKVVATTSAWRTPCVQTEQHGVFCRVERGPCPPFGFSNSDESGSPHWCEVIGNGVSRAVSISGGSYLGCLVDQSDALRCWGTPTLGFPFRGPERSLSLPIPLGAGRKARAVAVGTHHLCVLTSDGEVGCWGDGTNGELGYIPQRGPESDPIRDRYWAEEPPEQFLRFDTPAVSAHAAQHMSCALLQSGALWCWGDTAKLALSDTRKAHPWWEEFGAAPEETEKRKGESTLPSSPMLLPADCRVIQAIVEDKKLCVLCDDGCAQCWGDNYKGRLGYGDDHDSWQPREECLAFSSSSVSKTGGAP